MFMYESFLSRLKFWVSENFPNNCLAGLQRRQVTHIDSSGFLGSCEEPPSSTNRPRNDTCCST